MRPRGRGRRTRGRRLGAGSATAPDRAGRAPGADAQLGSLLVVRCSDPCVATGSSVRSPRADQDRRAVGARGAAGTVLDGAGVGRDVEGHRQLVHEGVQLADEPVRCGVRRLRRLQPAQRPGLGGGQQAGAQADHQPRQGCADPDQTSASGWLGGLGRDQGEHAGERGVRGGQPAVVDTRHDGGDGEVDQQRLDGAAWRCRSAG